MKKFLLLLAVLTCTYFGLKKWSPSTLEHIPFLKKKTVEVAKTSPAAQPTPEPTAAPTAQTKGEPTPPPVVVDKTAQLIVFCYHRIEGKVGGDISIAPELFEQHLQRIKDAGMTVVSMQDFLAWRRGEKNIPNKSALITIDDGYASAYEVARPILKKFGYPWTYFIYTKYVSTGGKSITWEQLAELRDEGIEIGCHTLSHISLRTPRGNTPELQEQWLRDEIIGSKKLIEQKLGIECATFAYPEGKYNSHIRDIVKEAGYFAAFTVYGQRITHSSPHDSIGRFAWSTKRPQDMEMAFSFQGSISSPDPSEAPTLTEPAASMMLTQPADGETVATPLPLLKANLATLGDLDPASVSLRLSGVGIVPCKYDPATKNLEARPPHALPKGDYTVVVTGKAAGKRIETQWHFKLDPAYKAPGAGDLPTELPPRRQQ